MRQEDVHKEIIVRLDPVSIKNNPQFPPEFKARIFRVEPSGCLAYDERGNLLILKEAWCEVIES